MGKSDAIKAANHIANDFLNSGKQLKSRSKMKNHLVLPILSLVAIGVYADSQEYIACDEAEKKYMAHV